MSLSKDAAVCDLLWTHPDAIKIFNEIIRTGDEWDDKYISYDVYQYPNDDVCTRETIKPVFFMTKRGDIDPKWYTYRTRSGAFRRLEQEKEKFDKDIEGVMTLVTIGRVARR